MLFNSCPLCKARVEQSILGYKAYCRRCNIDLELSTVIRLVQAITVILGFIGMIYFQWQGTDEILAQEPGDPFWALLPYYLGLVAYMSLGVGLANYVIRKYFALYEAPKNT